MGSKTPPCLLEPLCLQHRTLPLGSKTPFPICHCRDGADTVNPRTKKPNSIAMQPTLGKTTSLKWGNEMCPERDGGESGCTVRPRTKKPQTATFLSLNKKELEVGKHVRRGMGWNCVYGQSTNLSALSAQPNESWRHVVPYNIYIYIYIYIYMYIHTYIYIYVERER